MNPLVPFGNSVITGRTGNKKAMKENYEPLLKLLKKDNVKLKEAMEIYQRAIEINPNNHRAVWKAKRFTLYIWARLYEHEKGLLGRKIDTVRRVVGSKEFHNLYKTYPLGRLDIEREIRNLNKLITDPRQFPYFRSKNFVYKGTNKNIPQDLLDKIR